MERNELEAAFSKEIINPSLDLAQDYAQMGLDALSSSKLIESVPVVKTAVALIETGLAVRERTS